MKFDVIFHGYVIAAVAMMLVQGALIAGLLVARKRQRRAEVEARRHRDKLAHLLRVMTLGELSSSVAHEISQPLGAIHANAQAARLLLGGGQPVDTKTIEAALADIVLSAEYASEVIGRLRSIFRKEAVEKTAVGVEALIEDAVRLLHAARLAEGIDIRLHFAEGIPSVFGDSVQLEQVMLNVLVNACDAIRARGDGPRSITVQALLNGPGHVAIEVSDTGVGVKETELEPMFEQFFSTKPKGLGMGLPISRSIVNAHGGLIWATVNPDKGLTMHIELVAWLSDSRNAMRTPFHQAAAAD